MPEISTKLAVYTGGIGVVEPTQEIGSTEFEQIKAAQSKIEDNAVVCIDERPATEPQPVRAKMAGGNVATGFAAGLLGNWSMFTDAMYNTGAKELVRGVATQLHRVNLSIGGHVHNEDHPTKTGCGAADSFKTSLEVLGRIGEKPLFKNQATQVLGELFNDEVWSDVILNAHNVASNGILYDWSGAIIIDTLREEQFEAVIEELDAANTRPDIDPENHRHGHFAEAVVINTIEGYSNNRDAEGLRFFQVDVPAIVQLCSAMAINEDEFTRLIHAATAYQFAVKEVLTKNQPNIFIEA